MEFKSYTVKVKTPSQWEEFHNTLLSSSSVNHIPDREVICSDDKKHSPTRGTYLLTDDEANDLREHHFVDWIELCPTCNPDEYRKPELAARRFKRNIKVYRDLFLNAPADPTGSVVFDGNDGLDVQYDSSFALGSGNWTIEAFFKYSTLSSVHTICSFFGGNVSIKLSLNDGGKIDYRIAALGQTESGFGTLVGLTQDTWYHIALVRDGTNIRGYVNGVLDFSRDGFTASFATVTDPLDIGQNSNASPTQQFIGNISSVRFVNGSAVYTGAFTVPTEISNITNTVLLCCNSGGSPTAESTGKTITAIGDPQPSRDNPGFKFPYISDTVTPEVIRTNWGVQRVGLATNGDFWTGTGDLAPEFTDIGYNMTGKNVDIIIQDSGVLQYHPEFMDGKGQSRVRDIVLDGPLYLDPTSSYLQANTYTKADGRVGIATTAAHNWWNNNSSGYRSADFDAPETTGSVAFDGTFDYLLYQNTADPSDLQLGSASFTIEGWVYLNSFALSRGIIGKWSSSGPSDQEFIIRTNSSNQIQIDLSNGTSISSFNSSSTTLTNNTWHHFAVVRNGNASLQIYIDGLLASSTAYNGTLPSTSSNLIVSGVSGAGEFWSGYISNLRIVKGTALYTSNFTPPTQELTAITGTSLLCCQSPTDATEEATGKAITVIGNTTASSENPGLTIPGTGTKDFGTIAVSFTYVVDNTLGESLDGTSGITDGHGTACAGLSAGKNAGAAFEANIWNMSGIGEPPSLSISIEQNHDLMKIFHKYKPINPETGIKNPTIINGSWGYRVSFTQNGPINFIFRGTFGTYSGSVTGTGNDLLGKAMVDGLRASGGNRSFAVNSGSSATETAADELMAEGPIYIASAGNNNQKLGIGATDPDRLNTIASIYKCNHRDFTHPQGIGFDSANDYHPVICIGAMDDEVETNYEERKADYSNNGPGVDVWSPADSTLAPGLSGDSLTYMRYDDTRFYDRYFNGTSAAAPVTTGVLALYLQSNPKATQKQTKKWLNRYGSKIGSPYRDDETDDQTTSYWTGSYNMRGAEKRILFNPYYTDSTQPQQAQLITSGVSFSGISISLK